jgi:putative transposase
MRKIEPLVNGNYYHIYNCGINGEPLFREPKNYKYFLWLYEKYINPLADTIAWCLMGNHFHLLIRINDTPDRVFNPVRGIIQPHLSFSHLFNAYAQAYNNIYSRHGSLFERPFKRKLVEDEKYFKKLIIYIHNNSVHHRFCKHTSEYGWSSYHEYISCLPSNVQKEILLEYFEDVENFKYVHNVNEGYDEINKFIKL